MTPHIFIVDDDDDHLAALADLVTAAGYRVSAFGSGDDALAALETEPDLVISDLRMPRMDGMALLTALQTARPGVPVVLLTGHGDVGHAVESIRQGAEDFLEKPYDSMHLLAVVR